VLRECLGRLKPLVMSDRNQSLLATMPQVFEKENHACCVRHLTETFVGEAGKLGSRSNASKELVREMFMRVAYTPTVVGMIVRWRN